MTSQSQNGQTLAWAAIAIAVIALLFSFLAWNNNENDLSEDTVATSTPTNEVTADNDDEDAVEIVGLRTTAAAELAALRARLAANQAYDEALEETQTARQQLANAYANASIEAQAEWQELETTFDQLEDQLRDNSADALDTLNSIITTLERDVRTDND